MTEGSRPVPVAAIAGALFCVILIYLALQIRAGNDPAIGAGEPTAAPRQVIVRKVVIRRIVEGAAPPTRRPPTTTTAAAPAPAPPPAPAPVVSRGS